MIEDPSILTGAIIKKQLLIGSDKDGTGEGWKTKTSLYHLVKALGHLSMHIRQQFDHRTKDKENHLHKAISRLAMAAWLEQN